MANLPVTLWGSCDDLTTILSCRMRFPVNIDLNLVYLEMGELTLVEREKSTVVSSRSSGEAFVLH